jgi:hypothetical protein
MSFSPSRVSAMQPWGNGLWQWFDWRWPRFSHQFVTRTIWRPGFVPYRQAAWRPDVTSWTLGRYGYDHNNWARMRGTAPSAYAIDMNTGNVVV